jgi:hypothetical protein
LPDIEAASGFAGMSACRALKGCIRPSETEVGAFGLPARTMSNLSSAKWHSSK